jgi:hypothetical protein
LGTFPERALASLNAALTWLFDLLAAPAISAAPLTTLILLSAATGFVMLWVVGRTSNQAGIAAAKRRIQAGLFEIRLFNDNLGAVLRALGRVLWQNVRYLGYSLVPLAWVALPLTLVIAQLQAFYGYGGLAAGQPALLTLRMSDPHTATGTMSLDADQAIRVETAAVMLPGSGEVLWRIVPTEPGDYTLVANVSGTPLPKSLHVSGGAARRSPYRVGTGLLDLLLYPSEPPLPAGPVQEIALGYPEAGLNVLGWRIHWLIVYIAVSMATAFGFAKRFGVTL